MPVGPAVSYPGVYVQEVPSDVRTVTPVDTATCAFVGQALRGPEQQAEVIHGFADFQRLFGGLWNQSAMSFAVRDFFANGGSKAVIVRLTKDAEQASIEIPAGVGVKAKNGKTDSDTNKPDGGSLQLRAQTPGTWGNQLAVRVEVVTDEAILKAMSDRYQVDQGQLFTLIVRDRSTGETENFANVTVVDGPRRLDKVLTNESQLIEVTGKLPASRPSPHPAADDVWETADAHSATSGGDDGKSLTDTEMVGNEAKKTGIYALEHADLFNLLCIAPYDDQQGDVSPGVWTKAGAYCERRRAILLVDGSQDWRTKSKVTSGFPIKGLSPIKNAAIFFPRIRQANPIRDNQIEDYIPSGAVAGVIARTDAQRGVWKAPAGLDAGVRGVVELSVPLTDAENGELNPLGINCLRSMPAAGPVVWGARTMVGDDRLGSEWKYLPVRRTALFIEESLYRGTQWAVFEPNDEPLWAQLRLSIGSFMHGLYRQGAFQGQSPKEAYFVKCDQATTPQADIDRGIVNVMVGFAPLKPAEFVVLYIQQIAGELAT